MRATKEELLALPFGAVVIGDRGEKLMFLQPTGNGIFMAVVLDHEATGGVSWKNHCWVPGTVVYPRVVWHYEVIDS